MQQQALRSFAILLMSCLGQVSAADNKIVYSDRDGRLRSLNVVLCPAGEHVVVKDFKVTGTVPMSAFLIAQEELSAEHYSNLVELSKTDSAKRELPSIEDLLKRIREVFWCLLHCEAGTRNP